MGSISIAVYKQSSNLKNMAVPRLERTQDSWVRSANATTALCLPHQFACFLISYSSLQFHHCEEWEWWREWQKWHQAPFFCFMTNKIVGIGVRCHLRRAADEISVHPNQSRLKRSSRDNDWVMYRQQSGEKSREGLVGLFYCYLIHRTKAYLLS